MTSNFMMLCIFLCCSLFQLPENPVSVIDFVKIKNNHKAEAIYFYQNNWTIYREIALKKKQILSYQILQIKPDSTLDADLILTTVYKDSAQFKAGEANFTSIIMDTRPNGPKLLDSLKPSDFRLLVATKVAERLVAGNEPSR